MDNLPPVRYSLTYIDDATEKLRAINTQLLKIFEARGYNEWSSGAIDRPTLIHLQEQLKLELNQIIQGHSCLLVFLSDLDCVNDWKVWIKRVSSDFRSINTDNLPRHGEELVRAMRRVATWIERIEKVRAAYLPQSNKERRFRAFIGSSSEGLSIANKLQLMLERDLEVEVWNQGTVFGLGDATLEALEQAVLAYDFGIFVFTPDDELHIRGESKPVARDNVVFELGLFIGKLTRRRAFIVHPSKKTISLPSDLAGITTAAYDPDNQSLAASLGPVCQKIRDAVERAEST